MDFGRSENRPVPTAIKILIAGGFGVGKTTMVGAVSEIQPLLTEESLTSAGMHTDNTAGVETKSTTTVAMDFGRITIADDLVLYLFGTPGQDRFWFLWEELVLGALGAIVLADTRRLADCFPSVDFFEKQQMPFVVAVNCFDDGHSYTAGEVRNALDLDPEVPLIMCDARERQSSKDVLITMVEHALASIQRTAYQSL